MKQIQWAFDGNMDDWLEVKYKKMKKGRREKKEQNIKEERNGWKWKQKRKNNIN